MKKVKKTKTFTLKNLEMKQLAVFNQTSLNSVLLAIYTIYIRALLRI